MRTLRWVLIGVALLLVAVMPRCSTAAHAHHYKRLQKIVIDKGVREMSWIPLTDGLEIPNGSDVRPDGAGGWEYLPAEVGADNPCSGPIARFRNGELSWDCNIITCATNCYSEEQVPDPTTPEVKKVFCLCAST